MTVPEKYNPPPPREIKVKFNGVAATLAIPHSMDSDNPFEEELAPVTHKAAIILHGQGGHRDYCYQKQLAHRLAKELGIFSLRIDFRGNGDSDDNENKLEGRHLNQDVADIQSSAEFLRDGSKNGLDIDLTISSIISHSRGGVAMFLWALEQDELLKMGDSNAIIVPNLINCAARYTSKTVLERYSHFVDYDYISDVGFYRYGKHIKGDLAAREIITLSKPDFAKLSELSRDISVLSIYGLHDEIIPKYDSANFANALNRGPKSHTLKLIPEADHNFYGFQEIEPDDDLDEINPLHLPIKKGRINYNSLVVDYIIEFLSPENEFERFLVSTEVVGSVPRWKNVEKVSNFRDIGGWRILHPTFELKPTVKNQIYYVKPNVAFRCANISELTDNGLKTIEKLGIKAIFDLRSDGEVSKDGYPPNLSEYGITRYHTPVYANDDYSPQAIALRYTNLMTSWSTYVHVYKDMFEFGKEAFRSIFLYILEENQPFLFHCTAGKDRTGVFGMMYLLLAGVDKNTLSKEYELTTVGLKPEHPILKEKFIEAVNKIRSKFGNDEEGDALENMISQGRKDWKIEEDGFKNLISSRYEAMLATIQLFNELYGNIVNYMEDILGFSKQEIKQIYENIVTSDPNNVGFELNTQIKWDHRAKI
ncbi:hypothetical protein KGF54_000892 [Candida jiufengensis]|uniref:uncharacterized protein n=1 Tax=Candida jiufengensis TaxID=497108 RepID=UPI002224A8F1|nr:uncharacterized protein KGF54_000892 [Candida jiufengensis]KAI5956417.1 hypothetical protein KGF54_000892 [Candida jiufengensis]